MDSYIKEKENILKTKIAYDLEEYEYGLTCIGTPITVNNKVLAAISVSGPTTRLKYKTFENLEKALKETAKKIEDNIAKSY